MDRIFKILKKRKWPKGLSAPALELNTIIFKHVYWYMQLISGERLQDHWSSGLITRLILLYTGSLPTLYLFMRFVSTEVCDVCGALTTTTYLPSADLACGST